VISGATWDSTAGGNMVFDGVNDRVLRIGGDFNFVDTSVFSVSFWIKFPSNVVEVGYNDNSIFSRRNNQTQAGGWNITYWYYVAGAPYAGNTMAMFFVNGKEYQYRNKPETNVWINYTFSHPNGGGLWYKNGIAQAVYTNGTASTAVSVATNSIGSHGGISFGSFSMGDFKIFSSALTSNEQFEIYQNTKGKYGL
jgi:hypothetical protein